jgi:hypothetical protein
MATDVDAVVAARGDSLRGRLDRVEARLREIATEASPPLAPCSCCWRRAIRRATTTA